MGKAKATIEGTIVEFFSFGDLDKVNTIYNVVKELVKKRTGDSTPSTTKARTPRGPNKTKTSGVASITVLD